MKEPVVWAYWGHEPSYHLKRMHSRPSLFTLGEWSDEWQDRLRSEECIKKAADDGINVIYTSFYKGFGLEFEKEEIEKTKELVQIAHSYGIKVLGYCQLKSVYYETFLAEDPDAKKMAAKNRDGTPKIWCGDSYYRWATCYNSDAFVSYIKKVIDYGLEYVGLDGFWFDNSYNAECFCENCRNDFRRYLKANVPNPMQVMGINTFDYVEIPYFEPAPKINYDALYFLWHKYRQQKCAEVHNEIFKHVKEKSDYKALIMHNPAFPRTSWVFVSYGYNPEFSKYCDFVMAENRDNLINQNGKITTQILAYKAAERFGYKVLESSWKTLENTSDGIVFDTAGYPETYFEIAYYLSQSMIFGGLTGTPWLMRSTHKGSEMVLDFPLQRQTHQKVISYFKQNHQLFEGKPLNRVKVLYSADNMLGMCNTGLDELKSVVNRIHNANIPFSFVVKNDIPELDAGQTIVVPQLFFTDNEICEYLRQAAERGCKVIVLGEYNVCNIYGKARDDAKKALGTELFVQRKLADAWESVIKDAAEISLDVSCDNIVSEITQDQDGNVLVHLLSTKDRDAVEFDLKLVGVDGFEPVEIYSFEEAGFCTNGSAIKIKNFKTMATLKLVKKA